jgi:hypothetical protein
MADSRPFELELEFTDPYKRTQLFIQNGRAFFGLWRAPDIRIDGDEERIAIPMGLEGHLDLVAQVTLGDRRLWRAIAQVNKIDYPLEEVRVGDRIIIPKTQNVRAAYVQALGTTQVSM